MSKTSIEWTHTTWNPIAGCSLISAGCTNCYAMRMAARLEAMGVAKYKGLTRKSGGRAKWTGAVRFDEKALAIPETWKKPRRVFVNSMSDLFHPNVSTEFVYKVWTVMEKTPRHTYQILTKRPDRMAEILSHSTFNKLRNVWLGTSVEDGKVLHRLDELRSVPAFIRFVSFEPLIGSVKGSDLTNIHWAIVGGESGPNARVLKTQWVDEIFDMCGDADAAFFFKQWGGKFKKVRGRDFRGKTWDEMPRNLLQGA